LNISEAGWSELEVLTFRFGPRRFGFASTSFL
jgi:hypothetical protein